MTTTGDWCDSRLGYQFSDSALLNRALTHRSAAAKNNERLEFLGDAVLGLIIGRAVFEREPKADEGGLSRFRSGLVRRGTLADVAREIDLGSHLRMGAGERRSGGNQRDSVLANAFEAVIGAIFLDGGFERATEVVQRVFSSRLDNLPPAADLIDPKTRLQEYLQGQQLSPPDYSTVKVTGPEHARSFEVLCVVSSFDLEVTGTGTSLRRAEQQAADTAFKMLTNGQKQ